MMTYSAEFNILWPITKKEIKNCIHFKSIDCWLIAMKLQNKTKQLPKVIYFLFETNSDAS